ncbi:MAG TPA: alpha-1,2-fucosyltransferase, partial [Waddliaceae bacterium]
MGNQFFEYAAIRKFAIDGNTEFKLDLKNYVNNPKEPDGPDIRLFNIIYNKATEAECTHLQKKDVLYYLEKLLPYYKRRFVWEKDFMFDKNLIGIQRKNMYIRGQFQSPKYFEGIEDIIRKEFTLKDRFRKTAEDMAQTIASENNPVSVHIRRDDYLATGTAISGYTNLSLAYYQQAIIKI